MQIICVLMAALALLYLAAIRPRTLGCPNISALLGRDYAHRGLHDNGGDAPENSLAAFQKAVKGGYGIELDVQLTRDRVPVVFHDETLERICGRKGRVRDYTQRELQRFALCHSGERIPPLAEVLKLVNGSVPLIVEIKVYEHAAVVCSAVDQVLQTYKGAYCIESFHPMAVRWYRRHRPEVVRGQLSANFGRGGGGETLEKKLVHYLLTNFLCRPDFIAYDHHSKRNVSRLLCRYWYGALSVAWTIRSKRELNANRRDFDLFIFEGFCPKSEI